VSASNATAPATAIAEAELQDRSNPSLGKAFPEVKRHPASSDLELWAAVARLPLRAAHIRVLAAVRLHGAVGHPVWPGESRLAQVARLDPRDVRRAVRDLEALGLLERVPGGGRGRRSALRVTVPDLPDPVNPGPVNPGSGNPGFETPGLVQNPGSFPAKPGVIPEPEPACYGHRSSEKRENEEISAARFRRLRDSGGAGHSGGAQVTSLQPATPRAGISPAGEGVPSIPADGDERAPTKGRAPKGVSRTTRASPMRPNPAAETAKELAGRWGIPRAVALRAVTAAARMVGGADRVHQVVVALPAGPAPQDPVSRLVAVCRAEARRRADLEEAAQHLVAAGVAVDVAEALAQWLLDRGLGPAAVRRLAPEAAVLAAGDLREALERAPRTMHGWDAWRWLRDTVRPQQAASATTSAPRFRF
jgi:hypothetical protein